MSLTSFEKLLEEQVKDIYSAETQLVDALPKMAEAASDSSLKEAFESHLEETRGHVERLEKVAEELGFDPKGKTCEAMKGLVAEGEEVIKMSGKDAVKDAALIGAAQRVEHYEIAAYGTVRSLANRLEKESIADLFQETLDEEGEADEKLTDICESIHDM